MFCPAQNRITDSMQLSIINLPQPDSMERFLALKVKADTSKVNFLGRLSYTYTFNQADKAVLYARQGIRLAQQLGYKEGMAYCTQSLAMALWAFGNYSNALLVGLSALHIYEELKDWKNIGLTYYILANIYRDFGDYKRALVDVKKGFEIYERLGTSDIIGYAITGSIYDLQDQLDSASFYVEKAVELDKKLNKGNWGWLYFLQGNIHRKNKKYDSALYYYRTALPLVGNKDIVETYNGIAILYKETRKLDSSIYYATEVLQRWKFVSYQRGILQSANILADAYKEINQRDSAIKYLELSVTMNRNMFNQENERDIQNIAFNEQVRQHDILQQKTQSRNRLIMYALITTGLLFLIITAHRRHCA
jgi:tetratricopeptide (TPR) repeat protein